MKAFSAIVFGGLIGFGLCVSLLGPVGVGAQTSVRSPATFFRSISVDSNGASGSPVIVFSSSPTKGFYRIDANTWGFNGSLNLDGAITAGTGIGSGNGIQCLQNTAGTLGICYQFSGVPTVASGFGTSPTLDTTSLDSVGAITVGTGTRPFTGAITFQTAWGKAPKCHAQDPHLQTVATATTTTLTLTALQGWYSGDLVQWWCWSPK